MGSEESESKPESTEPTVADALRQAIDRTLAATAPAASQTRERAEDLVDGIAKRGQEARDELARRGQEAGAEIARRGQEAREALAKRGQGATSELRGQLETLERRLASIEDALAGLRAEKPADQGKPNPKAED